MAFNFSQSNGYNTKDIISFVGMEENTELPAEECRPILIVAPYDADLVLTLNLEDGQGVIIVNTADDTPFYVKDAKLSDDDKLTIQANGVLGCILLKDPDTGDWVLYGND